MPANLPQTDLILMDSEHYAHEKYGVSSATVYLIRPDWYIGLRGGISDGDRLWKYLARVFI